MDPKCSNPGLGRLITLYELGKLDHKNSLAFEAHLLECDYCFKELEEMSSAMGYLKRHLESGPLTGSEKDEIDHKMNLILFPAQDFAKVDSREHKLPLAMKGIETKIGFSLLGEFDSKDKSIHLRVLKDEDTNEVTAYILSEKLNLDQEVVVEISGTSRKFVSDKHGIVRLGKEIDIDFPNVEISVRSPLAVFLLDLADGKTAEKIMETKISLESKDLDKIILSLEERINGVFLYVEIERIRLARAGDELYVVVREDDGSGLLSEVKEGIASFKWKIGQKTLTISVY